MSRFCNVADQVTAFAGQAVCRWRHAPITWTVVETLDGFSRDDLVSVYTEAWRDWSDACGVRIEYVADASRANIHIGARHIDRQYGTLAEAELPCGNVTPNTRLRVWFDEGENWVVAANPPPGKIDLMRVAIHEFGHSLGIGHNPDGIANAIMDPSVSHIRRVQAWDIAQAQARYGQPSSTPGGGGDSDIADLLEDIADCIRRMPANRKAALNRWLG